jgi:hypothetical protein
LIRKILNTVSQVVKVDYMQEAPVAQNNGNEFPEILKSEKQKKTPVNDNIVKKTLNLSKTAQKKRKKSILPESTELTKSLSKKRINIQYGIEDSTTVEQFIPFSNPVIETVIDRKSSLLKSPITKRNAATLAVKIVKIGNVKSKTVDFDTGNNADLKTVYEKEFTHFPRGLQWRRKRQEQEQEHDRDKELGVSQEGGLKTGNGGKDLEGSTELRLKFLR